MVYGLHSASCCAHYFSLSPLSKNQAQQLSEDPFSSN